MGERPLILHLSADFPDSFEPFKTKAIKGLVDLTADRFEHHVVSINRVSPNFVRTVGDALSPSSLDTELRTFDYGTTVRYTAPGKGIRHKTKLLQLGDWLADFIADLPKKPSLIIGHKLAFEGIAVRHAAKITGIPYGISIQGDSDTKVIDARRDLTGELRRILNEASVVFPFAPWAWKRVTDRLGVPERSPIMLPCPTDLDQPMAPVIGGNGLISVFHLMSQRRKNLSGMVQAVKLLGIDGKSPELTIIGGGNEDERAYCEVMVANTPSITLAGSKDREAVRAAMNGATAFVLPSLRESFGLVFIEALFAGLPIIYPRGTSIDGYFDGMPFALPVDARDPRSIAGAMRIALCREAELKAALADWQQSAAKRRFQRDHIGDTFAAGLERAINTP